MSDYWRPRHEPARSIYDAILRAYDCEPSGRMAAHDRILTDVALIAREAGLRAPVAADVTHAYNQGCGHTDFVAQFTYALVKRLSEGETEGARDVS